MEHLANYYNLDKSIKLGFHDYIPVYEKKFNNIKNDIKCLVEIGIGCVEKGDMHHILWSGYKTGNSLRMWRDYFINAEINGLDINKEAMIFNENRIITHVADQSNKNDVINVINKINKNIDIIIDDGSHNPRHQADTFEYFHPYLKENSIYCIEDIEHNSIPKFKDFTIFSEKFQDIIRNEYTFEFYDQRRGNPYDNSVICMFIKKNIKKEIYISGLLGCGLGNTMFQIAAAAYYSEKFGYEIILDENSYYLKFGTSVMNDRDKIKKTNNMPISYKDTIFNNNKLIFKSFNKDSQFVIHNDYTDTIINPENNKLIISGYCQNYLLFNSILDKIPNYFNFNNIKYNEYIINKYNIFDNKINIMIGIRACSDFSHMNKISKNSYNKALNIITNNNNNNFRLIIISDKIEGINDKFNIPNDIEYKIIDEDDITQMYAGLLCSYFILCESTFHYWIALIKYIKDKNTKVYCFNNTDLTNRNLALPDWIKLDY